MKKLLVILLVLVSLNSSAQFIRLSLNLPAGVEINPNPIPPQVLEPPVAESSGYGYRTSSNPGVRWIELRAKENITFAVQFKPSGRRIGAIQSLYYLNDGTTNFSNASKLNFGLNELQMYFEPKMINNIPGELTTLSSWLGIPVNASGTLTLIYF